MQLVIKRAAATMATVEIDENTIYSKEFMGDDMVTTTFTSPNKIDVQVSDYITYKGKKVITPAQPPRYTKDGNGNHKYDITFYGHLYTWYNKKVRHNGAITFSFTGTPLDFMILFIDNMRLHDMEWLLGDVEFIDEPQTLTFDGTSCREGLTQVAEKFGLEYYEVDKKVYLVKTAGKTMNAVKFQIGRYKGLYELTREGMNGGFATVWYGQGGTQNLPENYRDGANNITFSDNPIIIEPGYSKYGPIEGTVTFEDVYPQRTSTVKAVNKVSDGLWQISDDTIDFDIEDLEINDSAKIVFKSGALGGNEFSIHAYDHATKTITFKVNQENGGYIIPNGILQAAIGDKYTLIGIAMPDSYLTDAEATVRAKTIEHAKKYGLPKYVYTLAIDPHYVRDRQYEGVLTTGDRIPVGDTDMDVDADLRIQAISWPLVDEAEITAKIAEEVVYSVSDRIAKAIVKNKATAADATLKSKSSLAAALWAKQVADNVANAAAISLFKYTTVTDLAVLTGAVVVGNPESGAIAALDGTATEPTDIVFSVGSAFDDRENASFKLLLNGQASMTGAEIEGVIRAASGLIGNWEITADGLTHGTSSPSANDAYIIQRKTFTDNKTAEARIGTSIFPASTGVRGVGFFENNETNEFGTNYGVWLSVTGALNNIAMGIANGDLLVNNGKLVLKNGATMEPGTGEIRFNNIKDVFVPSTLRSGALRAHVQDGKTFLVLA